MQGKAYLGICEHGKARAIFIDTPEYRREIADEISQWIRDGLTVQHMDGDAARAAIQEKCEPCDEKRRNRDEAQMELSIG